MIQRQLSEKALDLRRLMPPADAAEYLGGLVVGTLAKWRHFGQGPAFVRIGSRIFYDRVDLDRYIDEHRRNSTSEAA